MSQRIFGTMLKWHTPLAIMVKVAAVIAALVLLERADALFALGVPVLLLHAGALAMIAGLLMWRHARGAMRGKAARLAPGEEKTPHIGILLHSAAIYDVLAWCLTFGRERAFRERMLSFAKLRPGESVLDIGCGTGTVALLAKQNVGAEGRVEGIDASAEMIARATAKARRARLPVRFSIATAQELPFREREFDVVLSTLMFHHLPKKGREEFGKEVLRVLKPGGRVLIVDFAKPTHPKRLLRLHRHGHVDLDSVAAGLGRRGFHITELGDVGSKGLRYLIAQPDAGGTTLEA